MELNTLITVPIIIESQLYFLDRRLISALKTFCGNLLTECEKFNPNLLTDPCIGVGFERKLLLLPVYVLCQIDVDLTIYPYYSDETYSAFISKTPLV